MSIDQIAVRPGDADYEAANRTFMGTGAAAAVLRPTTAAEVSASVRHAVDNDLEIAVRSGGHHALNYSNSDGGVVVDVSRMDAVEVLDEGRVRVGAGATWGQVADVLAPHGLAITSGDTKSVGVGGLTQGGGMGWMVRKYGLTIDNLLAAELVTASGDVVRATAEENPDLFWGVRGGNGNLGVVTSFEFQAARVSTVRWGTIGYELEDVGGLVRRWAEVMRNAPDELTTALLLMPGFGDFPAGATVYACDCGDDPAVLEPLRSIGTVVSDEVAEAPYADVLEEAHPPPGVRAVINNVLVETVDAELADAIARLYDGTGRVVFLRALGGAFSRVPAEQTAFGTRDVEAMVFSAAFMPVDADEDAVAAAREPWWPLVRFGTGSYSGFVDSATPEDLALVYPADTYKRLVEVKRRWDPDNVFRRNLNVQP